MRFKEPLRLGFVFFCLLTIMFFLMSLSFGLRGRKNFYAAESALQEREIDKAVLYYDETIRNYSLLNFWAGKSRERLIEIARSQEKKDNAREAHETYQTLLSALASVETGYSPNRDLTHKVEKKAEQLKKRMSH